MSTISFADGLQLAVTVCSMLVAAGALFLAWRTHNEVVRLERRELRDDHLERIRAWADTACDLTVAALRCTRQSISADEFDEQVPALRTQLSAHADKGRWLFPNAPSSEAGDQDQYYRQVPVQMLVEVFLALDQLSHADRTRVRPLVLDRHQALVEDLATRLYSSSIAEEVIDLVAADGIEPSRGDGASYRDEPETPSVDDRR